MLWRGLIDLLALAQTAIITATLIRLPFFIKLLIRTEQSPRSVFAQVFLNHKITVLHAPNKKYKGRIKIYHCICTTFEELMKDLPCIPLALLIVALSPWKLIQLARLFAKQLSRIPKYYHENKGVIVKSYRYKLLKYLGDTFTYDYVLILMNVAMVASIYRIPDALWLLSR